MPLFQIDNGTLSQVAKRELPTEKELQRLIEANLSAVFKCQFVATEFSTGRQHQGRIDTLALSEDNNPVIIEYKKVEASALITQSLYYLSWIRDHHGDFELAVQNKLGPKVQVDWSAVRVICMAPSFGKFDVHAVQVMGQDIELWTYRLFKNGCIYIEEVQRATGASAHDEHQAKNPIMVQAGKKAALTRATMFYTFDHHLEHAGSEELKDLIRLLQDFILKLDPAIEEVPKKFHVAYRTTQNIVCVEIQKQKVLLTLKLNPKVVKGPPGISRDVTNVGHYGTGDLEITLRTPADLDAAKPFIVKAYQAVGA